jgi:hypothetical protein
VQPGELYVPAAENGVAETPSWMHGRRDEIVDRLVSYSHRNMVQEAPCVARPFEWRVLDA